MIYTKDMLIGLSIDSTPEKKERKQCEKRIEKKESAIDFIIRNGIDYTLLLVNSIDEDCYDYYIKEEDYLAHKDKLDELTRYYIEESVICGVVFYKFPEYI